MAPIPGLGAFGKFFGRTLSEGAGVATGLAVAGALEPEVQGLINDSWSLDPSRPLRPEDAATIAAERPALADWAHGEARQSGVSGPRFTLLLQAAQTAPGLAQLLELWRRGFIGPDDVTHGLHKAKLEGDWIPQLRKLKAAILQPGDLARAIHRGLVPDPGLLQGVSNPPAGNVDAYPVYPIDALAEAEGSGFNKNHLGVLVGLQGLPMGVHEAAQANFRNVITYNDYLRAVAEGDTRNEWAHAIHEQSREIPSTHEYVNAHIRGWIDESHMNDGTARHGMTKDDTQLLFDVAGRPLSWHQVFIGNRRGGKRGGPTTGIDPDFLAAIKESDIRPEWAHVAWAQRFTYPAAFVLRSLTQSHEIDEKTCETILLYEGWEPGLAKQVASTWHASGGSAAKEATATDLLALLDGGKASAADTLTALEGLGYPAAEAQLKIDTLDARRVASAKSAAISDLHASYKKGGLPDADVIEALAKLHVAEWAQPLIVAAWRAFLEAGGEEPPTALPPIVSAFSPLSGPVGATVTLSGRGFTGVTAVHLGAIPAAHTFLSDQEIRTHVPPGATSNQWIVTTPGGTGASGDAFTVT